MRWYLVALACVFTFATAQAEPSYNWTGPYIGGHGGWSDWTFARPDDPTSPTQEIDGAFGGAQIGYDYQFPNNFVIGAVADVSAGDLSGPTYKDGNYITVSSDIDAFGTLRGRLGYSFGHSLLYGTAGAAWMKGSTTEDCPAGAGGGHCKTAGAYSETADIDVWGYAYGGGLEVKLSDHISLFAEYLRFDFGTETVDPGPKSNPRQEAIEDIDVVRAGVNFRFGEPEKRVSLK